MSSVEKICVMGEFAVGKTSLTRRYVLGSFSPDYHATLGVNIYKHSASMEDGLAVNLVLWDVEGGQYRSDALDRYIPGSSGALIVADSTRLETVEALEFFACRFRALSPGNPLVFAINKSDLEFDGHNLVRAKEIAHRYDAELIQTSAAGGTAVTEAFLTLAEQMRLRSGP